MSDDMWHVQIEPGDVKTVTLEQMDDMYRLDLISASTLVWQRGMPKALPLSVIAGIEEEEEEEVMEIEPELIPEPVHPIASPRQQTMAPPPSSAAAVAPATWPMASPQMPKPDFYSPGSLRPITMSGAPSAQRSESGLAGRIVVGLAIAAGLLLTLHRNDLLRPMAASAGTEATYQKVESALGSPGFGTTRSVAQFSATLNPRTDDDSVGTQTGQTGTSHDSAITTVADNSTASASDAARPNAVAKPQDAARHRESRSVTSTRRPASAKTLPSKPAGKQLKSFKSSEYDPMNAKL
jgi:hypothetical protein